MSTRCQIAFTQNSSDHRQKEALAYRHYDGGPSAAGTDLFQFFEEVRAAARNGDTRFDDAEYLAARFVTWQTLRYAASGQCNPLAATGVGVTQDYHTDIEFLYVVVCRDRQTEPHVYVHRVFDEESSAPLDAPARLSDPRSPEPAARRNAMGSALAAPTQRPD
jgi:hypothetical protein